MSISDAELKAKFTEAFKTDDNFIDALECAENGSQMKEVLLRKGIDVTEEEAESFLTQIKMGEKSEFSEDEMEVVSGGNLIGGAAILAGLYFFGRGLRDGRRCR